ncbi:argininosuccinate lyase [Paenibacillus sp. JCM 10914]|nr:argininosuccinate lyase [Paenibacillus sp. JCM 10914]
MSKLWGGRFTKQTNALVEEYTASIGFDKQLAEEDIQAVWRMYRCSANAGSYRKKMWRRSRQV